MFYIFDTLIIVLMALIGFMMIYVVSTFISEDEKPSTFGLIIPSLLFIFGIIAEYFLVKGLLWQP